MDTLEETKAINYIESFGCLPETIDVRDYKLKRPTTAVEFPKTFELQMRPVKNQGSVGSCVAHALSEVVEYFNKTQENCTKKSSTGFIYGNRRNSTWTGAGMYTRDALANLCTYGDAFYTDFKENIEVPKAIELFENRFDALKSKAHPSRITKYFRVKTDDDIKYAIMNYGPVVFAMNWYSDISVDAKGVIHTTQDSSKIRGGHCMVIYGWDSNGWKIQNSWGTLWGKAGRAILPYNVKRYETWGIIDDVSGEQEDDNIIEPFKTKLAKFIAKIINFIANLFRKKK